MVVDNDANTTAWAEVRFGAARAFRHVLCLTLGTGIGGAIVTDRTVFRGANGMAGEFGHMQVVPGGHRCECGNRGCWEQYSSGNALVRQARELVVARSPASQQLRELVEDDPARLTGPLVTEAARAGDTAPWGCCARSATGWGSAWPVWSRRSTPRRVVIGGGVSDADELLLGPARSALARTLTGRGFRPVPPVLRAALGSEAGFIGAADLARELVGHR